MKKGTKVRIEYTDGEFLEATIVHAPQDVGDFWYFEDETGRRFAQNPLSARLDRIIDETEYLEDYEKMLEDARRAAQEITQEQRKSNEDQREDS